MKQSTWEGNSRKSIQEDPLTLTEPESSLPCSQQPATGPYPEPDASSPHIPTLLP
jgi:hypothetical protein